MQPNGCLSSRMNFSRECECPTWDLDPIKSQIDWFFENANGWIENYSKSKSHLNQASKVTSDSGLMEASEIRRMVTCATSPG